MSKDTAIIQYLNFGLTAALQMLYAYRQVMTDLGLSQEEIDDAIEQARAEAVAEYDALEAAIQRRREREDGAS